MRGKKLRRRHLVSALAVGLAIVLAACGSSNSTTAVPAPSALREPTALPKPTRVTLILDFIPNAVHAGIYRAIAAGYYKQQNIDLHVVQPTSTADTLKLIDAGKAQFGLADGSDVADQIDLGRDAEAVAALVQRPLGGLIALASERLSTAAALQGKTVGITGVPSDNATLKTVLEHAGASADKVHVVTIGFNGVQDLEAGKIAAFTGFWPDDGVQLQVSGSPIKVFKLDQNGGPAYPGLVVFTTQSLTQTDPRLVRAFLAATAKGYEDTVQDPGRSLDDLLRLNPTLQRRLTQASLEQYLPLFTDGGTVTFGRLQRDKVAALVSWMLRYQLIHNPISVARYGTNAFLPPEARVR
jgi:ABC-type nitrate/sulfonate/bicarbonate transport system substrate-binding protein